MKHEKGRISGVPHRCVRAGRVADSAGRLVVLGASSLRAGKLDRSQTDGESHAVRMGTSGRRDSAPNSPIEGWSP